MVPLNSVEVTYKIRPTATSPKIFIVKKILIVEVTYKIRPTATAKHGNSIRTHKSKSPTKLGLLQLEECKGYLFDEI